MDKRPFIILGIIVLFLITSLSYLSYSSELFTDLDFVLQLGNDAKGQNITNASYIEAENFLQNGSIVCDDSGNCGSVYSNDTLQTVTDRGATTTNNITAPYFIGNGSQLTGLPESSPAGSDGQIQFNDGGSFGASPKFTYNDTSNDLTLGTLGDSNSGDFSALGSYLGSLDSFMIFDSGNGAFRGGLKSSGTGSSGLVSFNWGFNEDSTGILSVGLLGSTTGDNSVAIGRDSDSSENNAVAIGRESVSNSRNAISIGPYSSVNQDSSITIGFESLTNGELSTSIGAFTKTTGDSSITIGVSKSSFNYFENNKNKSLLFGINDLTSGQQNLLEAEYEKGVRIGATSGETNTMTGDDLYVTDNTEIAGALALGTNTWNGLADGDINASTVYYDVLQAKSPIVMCSELNCKVEVPELKETYYIERDNNYNILNSDKPLPQVVIDKFNELKAKKLTDDARTSCLAQGRFYEFTNNECELNLKAQCESDGKSYWTGSKCLENPYLACEQALNTSWNLTANSCQFDAEKQCTQKLEWNWNPQTNECTKPIIPEKTLEQMQRECLADAGTMWDKTNNECVELRLYLAEPYTQPTGAHDAYQIGDVIKWNNKYYESVINANVWSPSTYPAGWKEI